MAELKYLYIRILVAGTAGGVAGLSTLIILITAYLAMIERLDWHTLTAIALPSGIGGFCAGAALGAMRGLRSHDEQLREFQQSGAQAAFLSNTAIPGAANPLPPPGRDV